jgi:hypothetical protein
MAENGVENGAKLASPGGASNRACGYRWRWLMAAIHGVIINIEIEISIMSMKAKSVVIMK